MPENTQFSMEDRRSVGGDCHFHIHWGNHITFKINNSMKNILNIKWRKNDITSFVIGLLSLILVVSCKKQNETMDEEGYTEVIVGEPTGTTLEAIGAEMDPHFFSQNLTRNDGSKESDWQYVIDRVKMMELKKFRIMLQPQWYEPVNDNEDSHNTDFSRFTFDSPEMQSLYKVLDLAQEQNMDVCIVVWGCPVYVSMLDPAYAHVKTCFMADPHKKDVWITGPIDYDEWAENYSALIKHLIVDREYTCVNEITPMNEPDGGPLLTSTEYIKMAKVLDARFKKDGIRDKVRFNLSDNTDTRTFYLVDCAENLMDIADIFNSHTYIFGYETPNVTIFDWEKNNVEIAARAGKKHLVGEFGSNQCVGATRQRDIDLYARGVLMTRLILNFLNAGASGVSYWSLIDQYYGKDADYQEMQQLGLWKYVKEVYKTDSTYSRIKKDYEVRPQYYSYSLLTRFLKPGAGIYPIGMNEDFAIGTAVKDTSGKWTYIFANGTGDTKKIAIANPAVEGEFDLYKYEERTLPADDGMIISDESISIKSGKLYVELYPNSVVLCRQK
jgi:alpha-galactosidase